MTEKRFVFDPSINHFQDTLTDQEYSEYNLDDVVNLLNRQDKTINRLEIVINENEKIIQSTYDELTKLRCIKKNLGRIKAQWDWIMEAIQYD